MGLATGHSRSSISGVKGDGDGKMVGTFAHREKPQRTFTSKRVCGQLPQLGRLYRGRRDGVPALHLPDIKHPMLTFPFLAPYYNWLDFDLFACAIT